MTPYDFFQGKRKLAYKSVFFLHSFFYSYCSSKLTILAIYEERNDFYKKVSENFLKVSGYFKILTDFFQKIH